MFPNGTQGQSPSRSGSRFPGFGDGISEGSGSGGRSSIKSHLCYWRLETIAAYRKAFLWSLTKRSNVKVQVHHGGRPETVE